MSEQTAVAESSAAPSTPVGQPITVQAPERWKEMDVSRGPLVNMTGEQRAEWRRTGEMPKPAEPEQPKTEDSAPSDAPKEANSEAEMPEPAAETETARKPQEHKKGGRAEQRINELVSETKRLKQELEALKSRPAAEQPKPQQPQQPQTYQEWRKAFKPSEWIEAYAKQNPESSYEDANAAMADYLGDVRDQFKTFEQ